jgi:hypothetical protein
LATCDQPLLEKLLAQGFTKDQIMQLCGLPAMPSTVGTCVGTTIARLEQRLQNGVDGPFIAGSGSAVAFANGGYQVSYEEVEAVSESRVGDPVLICLVRLPQDCPPGDTRGHWYTTTNLRTDDDGF